MANSRKPLGELQASDLMTRDVVSVPVCATLREAARVLGKARVSGAPVVDAEGRCVGVLSAGDFLRGAINENLEIDPADRVGEHMTADPVTTDPTTRLHQIARVMLDADVHRVIVVDEAGRPTGVVSRTDLVATLAAADRGADVA
jgi:CBS domain-containing protein